MSESTRTAAVEPQSSSPAVRLPMAPTIARRSAWSDLRRPAIAPGASRPPYAGASLEAEADRVAARPESLRAPARAPRSFGRHPWVASQLGHDSGRALDGRTRADLRTRFGRDFSDVRIHTDNRAASTAAAVQSRAFTAGKDVVFGRGAYQPETESGRRLLSHELAHVVQQTEGREAGLLDGPVEQIHRQQDAGLPPGGLPPPGSVDPQSSAADSGPDEPSGVMFPLAQTGSRRVQKIVMSIDDMQIRVEMADRVHVYHLVTCTIPVGTYEPTVTVIGNDFELKFGADVLEAESFDFSYRVDPGQQDPAGFLQGQRTVPVEVVRRLARPRPDPRRPQPRCVIQLDERELVPAGSYSKELFAPKKFERTLWSHTIPLAEFGWVDVAAVATGNLNGRFTATYGPGRLTDICLTYVSNRVESTAPIEHPLLDESSRTEVTTYTLGGQARFELPARLAARIAGTGELKISGEYLSVIEVAAAKGNISATADASMSGGIHAQVNIAATITASRAQINDILGGRLAIRDVTLNGVDLSAEVGARGRVQFGFRVDAGAAFSLVGVELWKESWNLVRFNANKSWSAGIRYSPNPGVHWDLGTIGALGTDETGDDPSAEVGDVPIHEDAAEVDQDDLIGSLLDEDHDVVDMPDGLDPKRPLPFDWYKPWSLYAESIAIPLADHPKSLDREAGPTDVASTERGKTVHDLIGIEHDEWPLRERDFNFLPYDSRQEPEKDKFNRLLTRLGYRASEHGHDADHAWDLYLRGIEYDRFGNLWPASNQEQRLAGGRHQIQMANYRSTLGNINGRYFRIIRERHPA